MGDKEGEEGVEIGREGGRDRFGIARRKGDVPLGLEGAKGSESNGNSSLNSTCRLMTFFLCVDCSIYSHGGRHYSQEINTFESCNQAYMNSMASNTDNKCNQRP